MIFFFFLIGYTNLMAFVRLPDWMNITYGQISIWTLVMKAEISIVVGEKLT